MPRNPSAQEIAVNLRELPKETYRSIIETYFLGGAADRARVSWTRH